MEVRAKRKPRMPLFGVAVAIKSEKKQGLAILDLIVAGLMLFGE